MTNPAALLTRLIIEIQTKANEIAEASRSEGGSSDPNLNLERLIQQAEADAEIAGYCTTEKSRQNRRDALVRSAASSLLALFVMDREKIRRLREVMERCGECKGNSGIVKHPWDGQEIINALHQHGLGFMADGPPMAPAPDGLLVSHVPDPEPEHPQDCGCRSCSGSY